MQFIEGNKCFRKKILWQSKEENKKGAFSGSKHQNCSVYTMLIKSVLLSAGQKKNRKKNKDKSILWSLSQNKRCCPNLETAPPVCLYYFIQHEVIPKCSPPDLKGLTSYPHTSWSYLGLALCTVSTQKLKVFVLSRHRQWKVHLVCL